MELTVERIPLEMDLIRLPAHPAMELTVTCRGRLTIEPYYVKEPPGGQIIAEDEVITQEEAWGTVLDIQYIGQLYRGFGWPHAFRRDEAFDGVDQLMDKLPEHRYEWEVAPEEWDKDHWC
jgi:hypothetical protein